MNNLKINIIFFLFGLIIFSCSPFRYIPENSYLLDDIKIKVEKEARLKDELDQNIAQKPNRKFLGIKFHMFLYRLSNPSKEKGYFKEIGEKPVVWDSYQTKKSTENIQKYLHQNGYFNAVIRDSILFKENRKVEVLYHIVPGKSYRIESFTYEINDPEINAIIKQDSVESKIEIGDRFRVSELINEKVRIQNLLLERGYYDFTEDDIRNYITFGVDTSLDQQVSIKMLIKNPVDPVTSEELKFYKHRIKEVYIFRNFSSYEYINDPEYLMNNIDTIIYDGIYFLSKNDAKTKPGILSQSNYIIPGDLYNLENENLTMRHLLSLRVFQNVEINFQKINDSINPDNEKLMDCFINLTPLVRQYYQVGASITNSPVSTDSTTNIIGNLGAEASLKYQYKNLLGNAEILDFSIRGAAESLFRRDTLSERSNSVSFGVEARLHIPKFVTPLKTEKFIKKFSPQTTIALSYKYYNRPENNTRYNINGSFGYNWTGNRYTRHMIDPIRINYVNVDTLTGFGDLFSSKSKQNPYFFESIRDKMITSSDYSFEYNSDGKRKSGDFVYFRYNLEVGGNILNQTYKLLDKEVDEDLNAYIILGVPFSQFFKTDFDFRFYDKKANNQFLVYRLFFGMALPYGNSSSVPFEKRYSIGGPNSLRAWQIDYLGPGTTYDAERYSLNGRSDVKLEFNVEYRFDMFWVIKGALFLDGGNLWSLSKDQERIGSDGVTNEAGFDLRRFYKEIALGPGIGIRFDWEYIILRFDMGIKVHDPARFNNTSEHQWIFNKGDFGPETRTFQMGIAYPF